jgi:hypothetical protein
MKLGIKQLYIDKEVKIVKGIPETENYSAFFSSKFNITKQPPFFVRCYRILSILKEFDSGYYEHLSSKSIEPPILFLYV